jgi:RNA polymerase subunit RPABC4/transcription elongation factor Spt4
VDLDAIPWPGGDWQATLRLFGALIGGYLLVLWFASILWVYRDIQSRSQDPVTQAIGVGISVVFPLVGLPVYMVVRPQESLQEAYDRQLEQEAILSELHSVTGCPNCRRPVQDDFQFCAFCGTSLKSACSSCGRLLQFSWRVCPTCQTPKPRPQPDPAEVARQREAEAAAARRPAAAAAAAQRSAPARASRPAQTERPSSQASANSETPRPRRQAEGEGEETATPRPRRPRPTASGDE